MIAVVWRKISMVQGEVETFMLFEHNEKYLPSSSALTQVLRHFVIRVKHVMQSLSSFRFLLIKLS